MAPGAALAAKLTGQGAIEVSANGASVVLSDGRELIDFGSYAVTLAGHRPPEVVAAVRNQLDTLPTSTRVLAHAPAPALAQRLAALDVTGSRTRVWFGLNGADAVDVALKLAIVGTGRMRILALEGGYHGKSLGALAATHGVRYRTGLEPLLRHVTHVPLDIDVIATELSSETVAAFIFEPIQGEGGVVPLDPAVLRMVADHARRHGTFIVADEVQMGLMRAGAWVLSDEWGIAPDCILLGKVLGGGVMPLSAVVCTDEMFAPFRRDPFWHSSAFSGHPLSCAAGLGALDALDRLAPRSVAIEEWMADLLTALVTDHPDVFTAGRGRGLAWGLVCRSPEVAGHVVAELAPHGLVVSPGLGRPEVLRLLPPLVATEDHVARAGAALTAGAAASRAAVPLDSMGDPSMARRTDAAGCTWIGVS
jgi:putrescine aminotransferase